MAKSKVLTNFRKKWGLTQLMMAEALDVPYRTYQSWELGEKIPSQAVRSYITFIMNEALKPFERRVKRVKKNSK